VSTENLKTYRETIASLKEMNEETLIEELQKETIVETLILTEGYLKSIARSLEQISNHSMYS